jgi:aldehyde dehydrogenase (NAD+)
LGGKSAALVFDDANLDKAVEAMSNGFLFNTSQVCAATSRLLVQEGIADALIEKLKARFEAAGSGYGDPSSAKTSLGPLADTLQLDRVMKFVNEGKDAGGQLLVGGSRHGNTGCFVQPTIFKVDTDNPLWKHEIFGPVLVVRTFKSEDEGVELANDTTYGLSGAVFSGDVTRAIRVSRQIDTGSVGINGRAGLSPYAPFGGHKMSGIGSECGVEGIMAYLHPKTIQLSLND